MKKLLAILFLSLVIVSLAAAQELPEPKLKTIGFLGKGLAISPSDPMNFRLVKAGVARLLVSLGGEETEVAAGALHIDDESYRLKNVTISENKVTAKVYLNDTEKGSLEVTAVEKNDMAVWVGTLTLDGSTYNLYILEAPRKMIKNEIGERISEYCKANQNDPNCRERMAEFCDNNPDDARCKYVLKQYCKSHLDDVRCREAVKEYCEEHPELEDCALRAVERAKEFCEEHPDTVQCKGVRLSLTEFCLRNPESDKCKEFCKENPDKCKQVIRNLVEFCVDNENHPNCVEFCKEKPTVCKKVAVTLVELCAKEPNKEECREYCENHPVACKKVTAELARFCTGNADNSRCKEYCEIYPNACKKVVAGIESYCEIHPDAKACEEFCEKHPDKCPETGDKTSTPEDVAPFVSQVNTGIREVGVRR